MTAPILCAPCLAGAHEACDHARGGDSACSCPCPDGDVPPVLAPIAKARPPALLFGQPVPADLLAAFGAVLDRCERTGEAPREWLRRAERERAEDERARQRD